MGERLQWCVGVSLRVTVWAGCGLTSALLATLLSAPSAASPDESTRCHLSNYRPFSEISVSYKPRGNRCEGLYSSPVSSGSLRLLGYHDGRPAPRPFTGTAGVQVSGLPSAPRNLLLRALTTRSLTNYAMDTTSVQRDGSYDWDTSVLNDPLVAMKASEMAFTACSDFCVDGPQTLYYPVTVAQGLSPGAPGYHVIVQSQRALKSLEYTLEDTGGKLVRRERIVRNVPARRPVDLPIPSAGKGVYTLKIDAVGSVGSQALLTVRIVQQ